MSDPLADVSKGQPLSITAAAWNAAMLAARDRRQAPRPKGDRPRARPSGYVEAVALNDTGADLREHKPAKVTAAGGYDLTDLQAAFDWQRRPVVTIGTPGASTDIVAVTLEAIPDGEFGRVAVAGWCACDVDVGSSGHRYASPTTDTDALVSGATGSIRILNTGTGTARRCAVYLGDQMESAAPSAVYGETALSTSLSLTSSFQVAAEATVAAAGEYLVSYTATAALDATAGTHVLAQLRVVNSGGTPTITKSPTVVCTQEGTGNTAGSTSATAIVTLGAGDKVQLRAAVSKPFGDPAPTHAYLHGSPASSDPIIGSAVSDATASVYETRITYLKLF